MKNTYYIGIDGGGTKTEAVIADKDGQVLYRCQAGATNPNDVGVDASVSVIVDLTEELLQKAKIAPEDVSLFAGISGALNHRDELIAGIKVKMPDVAQVDVGSDIVNLLYAELPLGDGACVICGTGSACFLRADDELYRIGGWGYLLDSAGSGYDTGRMALEAVLKAYDGRGQATLLTDMLTAHLGKPAHEAISDIYSQGKPYIASCAPFVFRAAEQRDEVAEQIMQTNAKALADMIVAAYKKIQALGREDIMLPVALGGSINQKEAPAWTERIQGLIPADCRVSLMVADVPMVVGAVLKALTNAQDVLPDQYHIYAENLKKNYTAYRQAH